jgi:hypothetical protein
MMIGSEMQQGAGIQPDPDAAVDLRPWAAYAVGCNPHALKAVLANWWEFEQGRLLDPSEVEDPDFFEVREELEEALRILLLDGKLNGAVYADYRRALDRFVSVCRAVVAPTKPNDRNGWSSEPPTGGKPWEDLIDLSAYLVVGSEKLQRLRELGESVGKAAHDFNAGFVGDPSAKLILELIDDLGKGDEHAFLKKLTDGGERQAIYESESGLRFDPELLDVQIRYGLLEQELPQPLLVLSRNEFVFYGKSFPLDGKPDAITKDGVAIIWALAEQPGKYMNRGKLMEECKLNSDRYYLQQKISRFRAKHLKPAIGAYFAPSGGEPTSIPKYCHIESGPGQNGLCSYRLKMDADRIRINGPRPDWMKFKE